MILTSIVIILYFLIFVFDFLPVKNNMGKKVKFVYFAILSISFCVLFLYTINITVPSPSDYIKALLNMFLKI